MAEAAKKAVDNAEGKTVDKEEIVLPLGAIAIFFFIGYGLYILNMSYFEEALPISEFWRISIRQTLGPVATGVMFLPMWFRLMRGGWSGLVDFDEYAVVTTTTYSDGSVDKSSDYGAESRFMGVIAHVIWFCVGYFVAAFASIGVLLFQLFTFITKFPKVRYKIAYIIFLAFILTYVIAGPSIARKLAPVFDPVHFNSAEITKAVETSWEKLFSANFSCTMNLYAKSKDTEKKSHRAVISYTKANNTTVIDITGNSRSLRNTNTPEANNRILQSAAEVYMAEFDKGKNKIPLGRYTFVGNELTKSETVGGRELNSAAITAVTNLLPENFIFNYLLANKDRLRIRPQTYPDYNVSIQHGEGTGKNKRVSFNLLKTEDDYKLVSFSLGEYREAGGVKIIYE